MSFITILPILVSLFFLFVPPEYAGGAAAAGAAMACLLRSMEGREYPAVIPWLAAFAGGGVTYFRDAGPAPLAFVALLGVLGSVELLGRRREGGPSPAVAFLGIGLCVAAGWYGVRTTPGREALGEFRRIVVIGDSLAAGIPGDGVGRRWPDILGEKLGADVVNLSYPGDTVREAHDRWASTIRNGAWKPGSIGWRPDLIVVELGGNDIKQQAGPEAVERDVRALVETLRLTGARILLVSVPGAILSDPYKNAWSNVARDTEGVEFMSQDALRSIFGNGRYTLDDKIHFNQEGHDHFAGLVAGRISGD